MNLRLDTIRANVIYERGIYRPLGFISRDNANQYNLSLSANGSVYYGNYGLTFKRNRGFRAHMRWENDNEELMRLDANNGNLTLNNDFFADNIEVTGSIDAAQILQNGQPIITQMQWLAIGTGTRALLTSHMPALIKATLVILH